MKTVLAAEFIAKWEGCRLSPYYDVAGYPTIGYGHKLSDDKAADLRQWRSITHEEALAQLDRHLERFRTGVERMTVVQHATRPLMANQMTALISFAFNLGLGALQRSALLQMVRNWSANPATASDAALALEWLSWRKATINGRKQTVEGLLLRRCAEVALFFGVEQ